MCQKWFAKFCVGDFSLGDALQSGPVEVDSNVLPRGKIANILKISKSVSLLVKMKSVSLVLWKKLSGLFGQTNAWLFKAWFSDSLDSYSQSTKSC